MSLQNFVRVTYDPPAKTSVDPEELEMDPRLKTVVENPVMQWRFNGQGFKLWPKGRHFYKKKVREAVWAGEKLNGESIIRYRPRHNWIEDESKRGQEHGLHTMIMTKDDYNFLQRKYPAYMQFVKVEGEDAEKMNQTAFEEQQRMSRELAQLKAERRKMLEDVRKQNEAFEADLRKRKADEEARLMEEFDGEMSELAELRQLIKGNKKPATTTAKK